MCKSWFAEKPPPYRGGSSARDLVMVSPVAAANVPTVVMTAIAMPAVAVPMSMSVAALHLDDGIVLGRQRRYRQPRGGRADECQHRQSGGYCNA